MNILFTVCGRGNSKGVKNKNIRHFLDRPLFEHTLQSISEYKKKHHHKFDNLHVAISTDCEQFLAQVKNRQSSELFIFERAAALAQDNTPKMYAIKDVLQKTEARTKLNYQIIVDLDITSPLRTLKDIEHAINKCIANDNYDVVFSVVEARRNPYFNMVQMENDFAKLVINSDYVARQQAPSLYDINASIYVYRLPFLTSEAKSPLQGKAGIIHMLDTGILDIDSENDFMLMEIIMEWFINNKEEYFYLKSVN